MNLMDFLTVQAERSGAELVTQAVTELQSDQNLGDEHVAKVTGAIHYLRSNQLTEELKQFLLLVSNLIAVRGQEVPEKIIAMLEPQAPALVSKIAEKAPANVKLAQVQPVPPPPPNVTPAAPAPAEPTPTPAAQAVVVAQTETGPAREVRQHDPMNVFHFLDRIARGVNVETINFNMTRQNLARAIRTGQISDEQYQTLFAAMKAADKLGEYLVEREKKILNQKTRTEVLVGVDILALFSQAPVHALSNLLLGENDGLVEAMIAEVASARQNAMGFLPPQIIAKAGIVAEAMKALDSKIRLSQQEIQPFEQLYAVLEQKNAPESLLVLCDDIINGRFSRQDHPIGDTECGSGDTPTPSSNNEDGGTAMEEAFTKAVLEAGVNPLPGKMTATQKRLWDAEAAKQKAAKEKSEGQPAPAAAPETPAPVSAPTQTVPLGEGMTHKERRQAKRAAKLAAANGKPVNGPTGDYLAKKAEPLPVPVTAEPSAQQAPTPGIPSGDVELFGQPQSQTEAAEEVGADTAPAV